MNETMPGERASLPPALISGRSLFLRLVICLVTVVAMSIGGAWLMHAAIDPTADAIDGAGARDLSMDEDVSGRLSSFGTGLRAVASPPRPVSQ
jgi:hypothetical protein